MRSTTLYEFAGGEPALLALATAHHARCLADPVLSHPFSHPDTHPEHIQRLAWYWAEVLGGPPRYSELCGTFHGLVRMHCAGEDLSDLNRRFLACFVQAMDDAGLPDDAEFRDAITRFMRWSIAEVSDRPDGAPEVSPDAAVPRWSWDGPQQPAPR